MTHTKNTQTEQLEKAPDLRRDYTSILFTIEKMQRYLGLSRRFIVKHIKPNLPVSRIGNFEFYHKDDIEAYIRENEIKPVKKA